MGDRTTSLRMQCNRLKEDGRENLEKKVEMVTKSRTNAEKRATDKNNQSPDITTVPSEVNIAQNKPDTIVSLP